MVAALRIVLSDEAIRAFPAGRPARLEVEAHYTEALKTDGEDGETAPRTERVEVSQGAEANATLASPLGGMVGLSILTGDGRESSSRLLRVANNRVEYTITADDVGRLLASEVVPGDAAIPRIIRLAQLVPIGAVTPAYDRSLLSVAVVDAAQLGPNGPLGGLGFQVDGPTASVEVPTDKLPLLASVPWSPMHVGVDGRFTATFIVTPPVAGWVWWLSGERQLAGFVRDDLTKPSREIIVIPLPALDAGPAIPAGDDKHSHGGSTPVDVTEAEVANNPQIYSEDPGAFCRPFSNPERVLSERSFAVVARVQQPDIGAIGSGKTRVQHLLDLEFATTLALSDGGPPEVDGAVRGLAIRVVAPPSRDQLVRGLLATRPPKRVPEAPDRVAETRRMPSGRSLMSAERPAQWEDDIAQYQAATVALGHILDFRVRTRSNGYSLGTVASTLTLAPRQAKRIQKISFERAERARRQETTRLDDRVSDEVTRERTYDDTVSSYLDEWARGSSWATSKAAAGGFGFAIPPIVGGVGGGMSKSAGGSEQEGGRSLVANEQQRLQDSIRRFGDAARRFESTVVTEVTQEEIVTGTTEVLRNPNYGHSLTVIYYQILRHLKVTTEFAGARECLYVPFAIKPFTLQRAYRWREAIERQIRSSRFTKALRYLRDVATDFQFSDLQPGARSSQRLTYLRGSITLQLAVERPADLDDGKFNAASWEMLSPMLGTPAYGIWSRLAQLLEAQRDVQFQREHAPTIAAKWANRIVVKTGGVSLKADCTLATRYGFNQTVRVDFMVPADRAQMLTRALLSNLTVEAGAGLPPRSIANVTRVTLAYGTRNFERTIEGVSGVADMVVPGTGAADKADVALPLDAWDYVDEREQLRHSVSELIEHLNEHVEYYHKAIWWNTDRDRLLMLLDGFYVPGTDKVSIASVVDREPVAIIGNSLVYRVSPAFYIGYGKVDSPKALYDLYADGGPVSAPLLMSLPTDGLYAQTIMDECLALEEHHGTVDWVLDDPDPELGVIDPSLLMSRRADAAAGATPTVLPSTIINLQNAPDAPAPTGLQGVLNAVTNPNAFRDMAGLAATQANAAAAFQVAAGLATNFGNQAAAIKLAEMARKAQATANANQQTATVKKAKADGLISDADATEHTNQILRQLHAPDESGGTPLTQEPAIREAIETGGGFTASRASDSGSETVEVKPAVFAQSAEVTEPTIEREELLRDPSVVTTDGTERFIVIVSGYNYFGKSDDYAQLARNRARVVAAKPQFVNDDNLVFLWMSVGGGKVFMNRRKPGGWKLTREADWTHVTELELTAPSTDSSGNPTTTSTSLRWNFEPISPRRHYDGSKFRQADANTVMGITDVYALLEGLGQIHPGQLLEFSILSHAYWQGPILVNSTDENTATSARDVADKDARSRKDFKTANMGVPARDRIRAAFATDGIAWTWGCQVAHAPRAVIQGIGDSVARKTAWGPKVTPVDPTVPYKADGTTPDDAEFSFRFGRAQNKEYHDGWDTTFFPTGVDVFTKTFAEVKAFAKQHTDDSYSGQLAKGFDVNCFGPPIGTSSNYAATDPYRGGPVVHWIERGKRRPPAEWSDPNKPEFEANYDATIEFFVNSMGMPEDDEDRGYTRHDP